LKRRIALCVVTVAVTLVAVLGLSRLEAPRLVLAIILSNWHPPKMVVDYISGDDWRRDRTVDTSRKFTAFLEQKFPVGTDEANVRSSLIEAGFKPVSGVGRSECEKPVEIEPIGWAFVTCKVPFNFFEYIWSGGIVCGHSLIVQWSKEDSGGIVRIVGNYSTHCL
jgi:hypothetical protein